MDFPIDHVRAQFPALASGAIFFDNPGGTQVPESVIQASVEYMRARCANVGGAFATSRATDATVAGARAAVADLLGAPDPECIVFGPSMTGLTFHIARSFGETIRPGDEIVVTDLDHDANVTPWRDLAACGATIRTVPITPDGELRVEDIAAALSPGRTRLLAITAASNALGVIPPLAEAIALAKAAGAWVYVDAVQATPHLPMDVQALGCDFLACSAYKFYGPHVGALYGRRECLEALVPHKVRPAKATIPHGWEQGTLNHEGLAAVGAAVDYLASLGDGETRRARLMSAMARLHAYESGLGRRLIDGLRAIPGVRALAADASERIATVSFTHPRLAPRAVAEALAAADICAWSGNYYALRVMESLGLESGAVRIGLAHYNTADEVDLLLERLAAL